MILSTITFEFKRKHNWQWRLEARRSQNIDPTRPPSFTTTFTDLTAGMQYEVRMVILMRNGIDVLNGEWSRFITKCESEFEQSCKYNRS